MFLYLCPFLELTEALVVIQELNFIDSTSEQKHSHHLIGLHIATPFPRKGEHTIQEHLYSPWENTKVQLTPFYSTLHFLNLVTLLNKYLSETTCLFPFAI